MILSPSSDAQQWTSLDAGQSGIGHCGRRTRPVYEAGHRSDDEAERAKRDVAGDTITPGETLDPR